MVYLAKCPVQPLVRTWDGGRQPFRKAYGDQRVYGELELDEQGRIRFVIKLNSGGNAQTMYIIIAKAHLYEMLMYHLTFRPIYPLYSKTKPYQNHIWLYDDDLSDIGITQFPDIDTMTPDDIKAYHTNAVKHMRKYIPEVSDTQLIRAGAQMHRLIDRQWKIDILYEAEKAIKNFNLDE